ncbi:hypothetical protein EDB37_10553 [Vibrio crassostreae]|nr:hypothetical protein EDB37_10553 [Vibrio crassostreae]
MGVQQGEPKGHNICTLNWQSAANLFRNNVITLPEKSYNERTGCIKKRN